MSTNHTTQTPLEFAASQSNQHILPPAADTLTDAVEFRVIRPGAPVRRLRLTGNRYTFGAAEGCSIRLSDPALRPMHAVLIRDAHRILVRAYSVPLEVNGVRTTEAILQVGDALRLGTYRFELLSAPGAIVAPPSYSTQYPQQEDQAWQEKLRREAAEWRSRKSEYDAREGRCDQREASLHGRESELWDRAERLRQRETELASQESAVIHIREEYDNKQKEVSQLREENRIRQQEIDKRDDQYHTLEGEYREYAEQAKKQLEHSQQQAETASEAVQKMREQFAALNDQLEEFSRQQRDLEEARNTAIEAQVESEEQRQDAEKRATDALQQLDAVREQNEGEKAEINERRQEAEQRASEVSAELDVVREQKQREQAEIEEQRQHAEQRLAEITAELDSVREQKGHQYAENEEKRRQAEQRVAEISAELDSIREQREQEQARLNESEQTTARLHEQVEQLQQRINEASNEASQLRSDYEGALASVRQLELLVDQTTTKEQSDRTSWVAETEELRKTVEQLSVDLATANGELSDLREANETLTRQLAETEQQRDEARAEVEAGPSSGAFESIREELDAAKLQLEEMQREHEETLQRLAEQRQADQHEVERMLDEQRETDRRIAEQRMAEALAERDAALSTTENQQASDATDATTEDVEQPNDGSSLSGTIALGAAAAVGSMFAAEEVSSTADLESSEAASEAEAVPQTSDGADEVWPTYESQSIEDQNLVTEVDTEIAGSVSSVQDSLAESDSVEDSAAATIEDRLNDDNDAEQSIEQGLQQSVEDIAAEPYASEHQAAGEHEDEAQWRVESEQSVESSAHFAAWEGVDDSQPDPQTDSASQDGEVQWQDESPEVSVNEMIDDIEQSVDQVITETDSTAATWDQPEQMEDQPEQSELVEDASSAELSSVWDAPDSEEISETGYLQSANEDEEPTAEDVQSDTDAGQYSSDTDDVAESYAGEGYEDRSQESSWDSDLVAKDSTFDPWSPVANDDEQLSNDDDSETSANDSGDHALSEMLIRDLEVSESEEADDNTQVMNDYSSLTPADDYEATAAWNHSSLESPAEDTAGQTESMYGEISSDPTIANEELSESSESTANESDEGSQETPPVQSAGGEDSIEDYMNRLLQRVQGDDDSASEMAETSTLTSTALKRAEEQEEAATEEPEPVDANAPLIPRSQAPERDGSLSAMRELANHSARSAVSRSVRIQARDTQLKGMMKFVQVGIALLCAVACYLFLDWGFMLRMVAIGAILVIAGVVAQEGYVLLADARRRMRIADETGGKSGDESDFYEPINGLGSESEAENAVDAPADEISEIPSSDHSEREEVNSDDPAISSDNLASAVEQEIEANDDSSEDMSQKLAAELHNQDTDADRPDELASDLSDDNDRSDDDNEKRFDV